MKWTSLFDFELSIPSNFLFFSLSFNFPELLLPFYFHEDGGNTVYSANKEMGSTDESFLRTSYEPKAYYFMETNVESLAESMIQPQFRHSQREGLSVGQSSSSVSERTERPVVERTGRSVVTSGQELNTEQAKITTLLDRQREQILAEFQAEIKKHEFQANYDRRSIQKLSETIESQQEELHRAQAEELQRRDQLLQQNWELREAHEMEELKRFQGSTFDTLARRKMVKDQDTILELYWQDTGLTK